MAGYGRAPAETRRRSNTPLRGEWVDLAPLDGAVLPELPDIGPGGDPWSWSTRRTWTAWRSDPVTAQWSPADVAQAWDTIELHNAMTSRTASEVRLRMDGLGLTPKGKRDLRWRVSDSPAVPEVRRSPARSKRRARLSVVQ